MLGPVSFDVRTEAPPSRAMRRRKHSRYSSSTKETSGLLREAMAVARDMHGGSRSDSTDEPDEHPERSATSSDRPDEGDDVSEQGVGEDEFRLLCIRPSRWVRNSLFDIGYMEYLLSVLHDGVVDNLACRYTTLMGLCALSCRCDSCRIADDPLDDVPMPRPHTIPFIGRAFQTTDECEQRAREFTAFLEHVFSTTRNCFADKALAHVYEHFELVSTSAVGHGDDERETGRT